MINKEILNKLQSIEAGLLFELPIGIYVWNGEYISGKKKVEQHNKVSSKCGVCGIQEPLIWHHIYTKSHPYSESTRGVATMDDFVKLLGLVRICPNCHYYIHQLNPYSRKNNI